MNRHAQWRGALAPVGRAALLLAGLAGAGLVLRALPGGGIAQAAAQTAAAPGGAVVFAAAAAALCAIGTPRQAIAYAACYVYGLPAGLGLGLLAQLAGCAADFVWARVLARDWLRRRMGRRVEQVDRWLADSPFTVTLMLRLSPVGNNLAINLLAGVSSAPFGRFLLGSALGYLPQTLVFGLIGAGVRVARSTELALGAALFAVSAVLGVRLFARLRRTHPQAGALAR